MLSLFDLLRGPAVLRQQAVTKFCQLDPPLSCILASFLRHDRHHGTQAFVGAEVPIGSDLGDDFILLVGVVCLSSLGSGNHCQPSWLGKILFCSAMENNHERVTEGAIAPNRTGAPVVL